MVENSTGTLEEASVATSDYTCPVCACVVSDGENQHICETCSTPHHKDCWDYAGGCAIFGCRKGLVRYESGVKTQGSSQPVSLPTMSLCSFVFKVHWLSFAVVSYGTVLSAFSYQIMRLFQIFIPALWTLVSPYFPLGHFVRMWLWDFYMMVSSTGFINLFFTPMSLILLGLAVYLFALPAAVLMGIHFRRVNRAITSGDSVLAKHIADRVDMPVSIRYAMGLNSFFSKITGLLLIVSVIAPFVSLAMGAGKIISLLTMTVILLIVRFLLLPLFGYAMEKRATIIATLQNRLIASAKQQKTIKD